MECQQKGTDEAESSFSISDDDNKNNHHHRSDFLVIPFSKTFDEDSMENSNEEDAAVSLENNSSIGRNECDGGYMSPIMPMTSESNTTGRNDARWSCDDAATDPSATRRKSMDLLALFQRRKSERASITQYPPETVVDHNSQDQDNAATTSVDHSKSNNVDLLESEPALDRLQLSNQVENPIDLMPNKDAEACQEHSMDESLSAIQDTLSENNVSEQHHQEKYALTRIEENGAESKVVEEPCSIHFDPKEKLELDDPGTAHNPTNQQVGESELILSNDSIEIPVRFTAEEMQRTTEELGASRNAFIQRLRGAAFRRKMNLTRSRDSLVAKEREHREAMAASMAAKMQQEQQDRESLLLKCKNQRSSSSIPSTAKMEQFDHTFKARPVPVTTGLAGSGGLFGVPKVEKRPTTTPLSPRLGVRRQSHRIKSARHAEEDSCDQPFHGDTGATTFHARPLPKTNGHLGAAGQFGVPKVPKRPVTVPLSPLLGTRRSTQHIVPSNRSKTEFVDCSNNKTIHDEGKRKHSVEPSNSEHSLLGLELCSQKENDEEAVITPRNTATTQPFVPHSTARALKRAEYDMLREKNEARRKEEERQKRKERIETLRKELGVLRKII